MISPRNTEVAAETGDVAAGELITPSTPHIGRESSGFDLENQDFCHSKISQGIGGSLHQIYLVILLSLVSYNAWTMPGEKQPGQITPAQVESCEEVIDTGEITSDWVQKMHISGRARSNVLRRVRESVQVAGFEAVATSRELLRAHNNHYTKTLDCGPVRNQGSSGRCWIFAATGLLKQKTDIPYSVSYLHFFHLLEQANTFLESAIQETKQKVDWDAAEKIQLNIHDGGSFDDILFLVEKYGLVPKSLMPDTHNSLHTTSVLRELERRLVNEGARIVGAQQRMLKEPEKFSPEEREKGLRALKRKAMRHSWELLATFFGDPPGRFLFRGQEYTPNSFAKDVAEFKPENYVVVMSSTRWAYNLALSYQDSGHKGRYLNLPINRLEELTVASINADSPVVFSANVRHDIDRTSGIMHPDIFDRHGVYDLAPTDPIQIQVRANLSFFRKAGPNHAMLITGYDRPNSENGTAPVIKFKVENSWGLDSGDHGNYHMYREWFNQNVYRIVIDRSLLSTEERAIWDGEAAALELTDPLF